MHILPSASHPTILHTDKSFLVKYLWGKLQPHAWPVQVSYFPVGSALVGGAIRDCLLNRFNSSTDLDLVVPNQAIKVAKNLATNFGGTCVVLDNERDIARLIVKNWTIDLASQLGPNLEADLLKRDYRVNAIALTLDHSPKIVDPTGGLDDISKKILIAVNENNLLADPLRPLRGLRLMATLGFNLDPQTKGWIKHAAKYLHNASPERIQAEIQKIVDIPNADNVIALLKTFGMLDLWRNKAEDYNLEAPSLVDCRHLDLQEISLALPLARITHLISDDGLKELRFSINIQKRCKYLREWQQLNDGFAFKGLNEEELLKLHQDLEKDLPALILKLHPKDQAIWIKRWRDPNDPLFHPSTPLNGNTLKECLHIEEGPELGKLIRYLSKEKAFGRLQNREDALKTAHEWCVHNYPLL